MRLLTYVFLTLFFITTASAQNSNSAKDTIPDTEAGILEALKQYPSLSFNSPKEKEEWLLRLKSKSHKLGYTKGILQSGDLLMNNYSLQGLHKKAVEIGNEMKKIPKNDENIGVFTSIYQRTALALSYLGLHEASLKDFKTAISYAERMEDKSVGFYFKALCYENMTGYYHNKVYTNPEADHKENYDSIKYYLDKSLETIKKIKDNNGGKISNDLKYEHIAFIDIRLGIFYLEQSELEKAEKHFLEAYRIHQNKAYNISGYEKVMLLNQLSLIYLEKKDYQKSIEFGNSALQLEKQFSNANARVESFEFLASSYTAIGEKEKAAFYLREFSQLKDSIRMAERNNADITMNTILKEIDHGYEKNLLQLTVYFIIIVVVVAIAFYLLWKRRNKIFRKKYDELVQKIKEEDLEKEHPLENIEVEEEINTVKSTVGMTDETEKALLGRLEKFEKNQLYLNKDINRVWLTSYLNTRYLKEVIKIHKNKTYNNYINGLRVNYLLHKLVSEPIYREYKIDYLAEECGYSSRQVFLVCFKKETGVTPSYFIENLKKEDSN